MLDVGIEARLVPRETADGALQGLICPDASSELPPTRISASWEECRVGAPQISQAPRRCRMHFILMVGGTSHIAEQRLDNSGSAALRVTLPHPSEPP